MDRICIFVETERVQGVDWSSTTKTAFNIQGIFIEIIEWDDKRRKSEVFLILVVQENVDAFVCSC